MTFTHYISEISIFDNQAVVIHDDEVSIYSLAELYELYGEDVIVEGRAFLITESGEWAFYMRRYTTPEIEKLERFAASLAQQLMPEEDIA